VGKDKKRGVGWPGFQSEFTLQLKGWNDKIEKAKMAMN
jgi:hypothetical protein